MSPVEKRRLQAAEAQAWACREALRLIVNRLANRGLLSRAELFDALDASLLAVTETWLIEDDAEKTLSMIDESFRLVCSMPKAAGTAI